MITSITPHIAEYLKYAELQMAAEAFLRDGSEENYAGNNLAAAVARGNDHASRFSDLHAANFAQQWIALDQQANTTTGFSGTLFKCIQDDPTTGAKAGELVMSFRSTEFIDDAARDNQATNALEIAATDRLYGMETLTFAGDQAQAAHPVGSLQAFTMLECIASFPAWIAAFGVNAVGAMSYFLRYSTPGGSRPGFSGLSYLASQADLASAYGVDVDAAASHYILQGYAEGRSVPITARALSEGQGVLSYVQHGSSAGDAMRSLGAGIANALYGMDGSDTLQGSTADDTLDGGRGDDLLAGGAGSDTYRMARGGGSDRVVESEAAQGDTDIATFGNDIASDQLWFRRVGDDLEVSVIGSSDRLTVDHWYAGAERRLEQFRAGDGKLLAGSQVDALVQAMASFSPPADGQTLLSASYRSELGTLLAASWH